MTALSKLHNFDNFFDLFFDRAVAKDYSNKMVPSMNAHESEKEISLSFELPGFNKEDIEVTVDKNQLVVSATHKEEKEEDDKNWIRREISSGHFERRVTLPENVNLDKINAESKNGILTVNIPKEKAVDKTKKISVKG